MKLSPASHPNAAAAIIAGYIAQVIVYAARKAGVDVNPQEAMTASVVLIGFVLAVGKRYSAPKKP